MQSETGFPSSHQLKSYVDSKSRLKLVARAVLSADAGLLVITANICSRKRPGFPSSHQLKSYVASKSRLKLAARAVLSADAGLLVEAPVSALPWCLSDFILHTLVFNISLVLHMKL